MFNPCNSVQWKSRLEALKELWPATASKVILIIRNVKHQKLLTAVKRYYHMTTYLKGNASNTRVKRQLNIRWDYDVI